MIGAKVYGAASTIITTLTVGAAQVQQLMRVPYVGMVPVFAVAVGILTAILVRVVVVTSSPGRLLVYNIAVTALSVIGTATFIIDHQITPGMSFWVGAAFGATGVGLVQLAKSKLVMSIVDGIRAGLVRGIDDRDDTGPQR